MAARSTGSVWLCNRLSKPNKPAIQAARDAQKMRQLMIERSDVLHSPLLRDGSDGGDGLALPCPPCCVKAAPAISREES